MSKNLSRRQFLKIGGLALRALAVGPGFPRSSEQDYGDIARVTVDEIDLYSFPRDDSEIIGKRYRDQIVHIYYEVTSLKQAPALTREIWQLAAELGIAAFHPTHKYTIIDDHSPLQTLGIPAVLLIDYDYPHWHTFADTMDKVSAESLESVGRLLLELVRRWDAAAALAP